MSAKRYGAYHRVSDAAGRDLADETTITDKEAFDQIDTWAKLRKVKITERYLDWDKTGSKMSRPALDRMLADLDAGKIDGIVVAQVDRLSRAELGDALAVIKQIAGPDENHPRPLVLLDLGIDPSTEMGEFGLTILLALARMQWRRYKRQWNTAVSRAVARGVWIGSAPLGFRHTILTGENGREYNGPLEFNDDADVMLKAFEIAGADGIQAARAHLAEHFPGQSWRTEDAKRVLSCVAYRGWVKSGDLINKDAHPPLVTPAEFEAAQTEKRDRHSNGDYPLSGLATCECGGPMVGGIQRIKSRGYEYRRMRCSVCDRNSISADKLEAYVRNALREPLSNLTFRQSFAGADVTEAERVLRAAEAARDAFAVDLEYEEAYGREATLTRARAHRDECAAALEAFQTAAAAATRTDTLPTADEIDNDDGLRRAVRAGMSIVITKVGRGSRLPIDERVSIEWHDFDDDSGVAAA